MGELDKVMRSVLQYREYFADICNMMLFQGEQVIRPEALQSMESTLQLVEKRKGKALSITKYRDSVYEAELGVMSDEGMTYVILGVEHQLKIDVSMPVRNLLYDALQLEQQVRQISEERESTGEKEEFLSPLNGEDRLKPVITMVLYTGEEPWEFPVSLQDVEDRQALPKELWRYTPNLDLLVLDVKHSSDLGLLHTYLQQVFTAAQYTDWKDKERLQEYMSKETAFHHLPGMLANLAGCLLKMKLPEYPEKGEVDMCGALEALKEEERAEGLARGHALGLTEGRANVMLNLMKNMSLSASEAFALLGIPKEEQEACLVKMEALKMQNAAE